MGVKIKVGCCGFPLAKREYYDLFDVVEIQQTFYQPPELKTAMKWREEAPKDFEFTLKAWQLITHDPKSPTYRRLKLKIPENKKKNYGSFKPTDEVFDAWERIDEISKILRAKIIVFQCPASFVDSSENVRNLKKFFRSVKKNDRIFAWEPRGKWEAKRIKSLCQELDLIHCVDPFKSTSTYGKIKYFRLHGIGGYQYKYTNEDFEKLAGLAKGRGYFMFNNVYMLDDALRFKKTVEHETLNSKH